MSENSVGKSYPRVDARGKVTGQTLYSGDLVMKGMLHMKILMAERPHARVKDIRVEKALASPGVVAVYTAKDVPLNEYGLQIPDQPVLCGGREQATHRHRPLRGDQVAVVVANFEVEAEAAMKLIRWITKTFRFFPTRSLPCVPMRLSYIQTGAPRTCACITKIRKGNVDAAFANADVIVEGEYHTPVQEHAYLSPKRDWPISTSGDLSPWKPQASGHMLTGNHRTCPGSAG